MAMVGGGAYAATNWVVGLSAGSSGEGQSATIANLTITAVAAPSATNLLFPGGNGACGGHDHQPQRLSGDHIGR